MLLGLLDHLGVIAQPMLGLEGPNTVEVVGSKREAEQHRRLDEPHDPEEPPAQIGERPP